MNTQEQAMQLGQTAALGFSQELISRGYDTATVQKAASGYANTENGVFYKKAKRKLESNALVVEVMEKLAARRQSNKLVLAHSADILQQQGRISSQEAANLIYSL